MSEKPTYEELEKRVQELEQERTKSKQVEEELQKSKQLIEGILNAIPVRVFWKDKDLVYLGCNTLFAKDAGFAEPIDIIGKDDYQMGWRNQAELYRNDDWEVIESGESKLLIEEPQTTPAGNTITLLTSKIPLRSSMGEINGVLGTYMDITDRKQAEEDLAQIFTMSLDMLCIADISTATFIKVNPAFTRTLGYSEEELLEKSFIDFIHPDDIDSTRSVIENQLMQGTTIINFENRYRCKNGSYRWLNWVSYPIPQKGKTYAVAHDITDRKDFEKSLENQNRLMTTLLDNLQVGVFMIDAPSGKPLLANKQAMKLLGQGILSNTDRSTLAVTYQAYKAGTNKIYPESELPIIRGLKGESSSVDDMIVVKPNGNSVCLEVFGSPVLDKQGKVKASLVSFQDITDRKKTEEDLRSSHERFLTVLSSIDATIYVADMKTYEILFMNKHMVDSFGRDMTGEICWKAFREEITPCLHCNNDRLVDQNGRPTGVKVSRGKNPVTGKWYINYDRAIEWIDGRLVHIQIATDISEMKKLENQLSQAQKMESVGRLAGGVAHDFNNMLSVILGYASLALEEVDPAQPLHATLQEIIKAGERSADLTQQLLAFARKQTVAPKVLDLNKTVRGMTKMLKRLIGEDIELAWLPGDKVWPVKMDPSQIDQILANLCVNARDAIADIGKITIETGNSVLDEAYCNDHTGFVPGEYVLLAVSDNGCGMDTETLDNVFEPFFTTKELGKGHWSGPIYGLRHSQTKRWLRESIQRTRPGTTFRIYLPRYLIQKDHLHERDGGKPAERGHETILLVEDEPTILRMTTIMLERLGYTVVPAKTPGEAILLAQELAGKINLLMTDVVMPEMNGRDLAKNILSTHPNLKRLFMSGYTANVIAHHGVLDDGVNFIQKPFSKEQLSAKVREALGGGRGLKLRLIILFISFESTDQFNITN